VILDLRDGSGEMVGRIASAFFRERTLVGSAYDRLTDTTTDEFIDPAPPERRLAADVYVSRAAPRSPPARRSRTCSGFSAARA
jgi:hypothetical protein